MHDDFLRECSDTLAQSVHSAAETAAHLAAANDDQRER
jgi:hypothetical protein